MKTKVFVTSEIDDPILAAEELSQKVAKEFPLMTNSVGLLFAYSDMELDILARELYRRLQFPVVGATAIAAMDQNGGFHELSVTLMVFTAEDCQFSTAVSAPITAENVRQQVEETYRRTTDGFDAPPALVYVIPPYKLDIMLDAYTDIFQAVAPGVPFVGGLPSYQEMGDLNATIFNDTICPEQLVMLSISGNLQPVFSVQTVLQKQEIKKRRVTKAKDNVIYTVDNKTFVEYLNEIGMPLQSISDINKTVSLVANPLLVEETGEGFGADFRYLRALHNIDFEHGSGTAIGRVPEGAYVSINPLNRSDIGEAARLGMQAIKEQMRAKEAQGYAFTTVLTVSCIGRYTIMTPKSGVETESLLEELPEGLELAGFYSYGEISPLPTPSGQIPFAHNESLVICAF